MPPRAIEIDWVKQDQISASSSRAGGRGGIRTHGEFNPTLDFESSALNRTQPPFLLPFLQRSSLRENGKPRKSIDLEPGCKKVAVSTGKHPADELESGVGDRWTGRFGGLSWNSDRG